MNAASLQILENGTVQGLYTELIDLSSLGRLHIQRASSIEFDNTAQIWRVVVGDGQCLYCSTSRTDCLNWEMEHFEKVEPSPLTR